MIMVYYIHHLNTKEHEKMRKELKQLLYYQALVDIVTIFGETECGSSELDTERIAQYVSSVNFFEHTFDAATKEDIYDQITEEIINGFPIWRFLKCSDWTMKMFEKDFMDSLQ
jgi:hypothetical protein